MGFSGTVRAAWTSAGREARRALACAWLLVAPAAAVLAAPPALSAAASAPAPAASAVDAAWLRMADTVFEHIAQRDGLPNAIATAIVEDDQGYLWAGTQEGLARWDGYRFRVYQARRDAPGGLPAGFIRALARDSTGRLWLAMDSGGMARFDPVNDRFVRFGGQTVNRLSSDGAGGMWGASATGLLHVRADDTMDEPWARDGRHRDPLPGVVVTAVLQDHAGAVWIGLPDGLERRYPDGRPGAAVELPGIAPGTRVGVNALVEDAEHRIWIGTALHGVFVVEPADGRIRRLGADDADDPGLATDSVNSFAEAGGGEMWIGTTTSGIVVADEATLRTRRIVRDRAVPTSLQSNWIWAVYRDRAGQMWVASTTGLSRTSRQDAILTLFSSDGRAWKDPSVFSVVVAPDASVVLGQHGALETIDPLRRKTSAITAGASGDGTARTLGFIDAVARQDDGTVWVGAVEGLFVLRPGARVLQEVVLPQRAGVNGVTALLIEGTTMWIGGTNDGLWKMDLASPTRAVTRPVPARELSDPEIITMARGADGALWVGTKNGLNRIVAGQPVERIPASVNDATGLPAESVNALANDRQGRLWVATTAGIAVLVARDAQGRPVFRRIGAAEGLSSLNIDQLLLDGTGRMWASTDDGLAVIDTTSFALRGLHAAEGVAISTYFWHSGAAAPTGELIFGGLGGLTVVRPQRLTDWTYVAPVVATDVQVGGNPVRLGLPGHLRTLTVPPEAGSFSVEFSLLDFTAPGRARYKVWLEGYDKTWRETDTTHRLASYTNLAPGRYKLHVTASNRDGAETDRPLLIDVDVLPAWHQTWWFNLLKLLLAALAVAAVVAVRVRYVQRRSVELERLVEQRTREMTELQHQLEELAYSDSLTGLPNRRMFTDFCRRLIAMAERRGSGFALLLIDLDHFKQVNDTLGHDAGDALLVEVARRLREAGREADLVARLGGDEFAILLVDAPTVEGVEMACRRILDAFAAPALLGGVEMHIGTSLGAAMFPAHGASQDELYKSADVALYEAKHSGRNTWRLAGDHPSTDVD